MHHYFKEDLTLQIYEIREECYGLNMDESVNNGGRLCQSCSQAEA